MAQDLAGNAAPLRLIVMKSVYILWLYIVLLVIGGLIGFLKAKSKVSLYVSVGFAAALSICAAGLIPARYGVSDWLLAALLLTFAYRLVKTKKFMPSGLLLILTILTMALEHLLPR